MLKPKSSSLLKLSYFFLLLVLIFFFFACYDLNQSSFWRDEAFTAILIRRDFFAVINKMAGDFSPFFHPILVWIVVQIFGPSETVMRSISFIAALLSLYYLRKIFKNRFNKNLASILYLLSFISYYYAVEARYYALLTFLTIGSFYYSLNFFQKKRYYQAAWIFFNICLLYTHSISVFIFLANFLIVVFPFAKKNLEKKPKKWLSIFQPLFIISLPIFFYLPWFFVLLKQMSSLKSNPFWLSFEPGLKTIIQNYLPFFYWSIIKENSQLLWPEKIMVLTLSLLAITGIIFAFKNKKWPILTAFFLPLICIYFFSYQQPLFYIRYLLFLFPYIIYFITLAVNKLLTPKYALFLVLVIALFDVKIFFSEYYHAKKADYDNLSQYVNQENKNSDYQVINETEFTYFPCEYYLGQCLIAKQKNELANVGIVLIDPEICIGQQGLANYQKIIFISYSPAPWEYLIALQTFQHEKTAQFKEIYIHTFSR